MKIIDLNEEYYNIYFMCLEDWSQDIKEAGDRKKEWFEKMKSKELSVKLAVNEEDKAVGMIQYSPIEHSFATGKDLYFILCIWVHGWDEGVGNYQKKGIGKKFLKAAEDDVRSKAKGIVAWGISLPFWMKASWFKKQGYVKVDKQGISVLLWKPFSEDVIPPKWIKPRKKPNKLNDKLLITCFNNGWCPAQNLLYERIKKVASEFGDNVILEIIDTMKRDVFEEWGIADGLLMGYILMGKILEQNHPHLQMI